MVVMAVMVDTSHFRSQPNVHVNFSVMAVMAVMVVTSHFHLQPNIQAGLCDNTVTDCDIDIDVVLSQNLVILRWY